MNHPAESAGCDIVERRLAAMFEIVEKHKHTAEEKRVIVLEYLAALAVCGIVGVILWIVFTASG
jgi:hypothetical protein